MNPEQAQRRGIVAGGNWIVDHVKLIETWPEQDTLVSVLDQTSSNGGSPYNILKDLVRLGANYPLEAIGLVGKDADGAAIVADCRAHGIDVGQLAATSAAATSYTDVMTVKSDGRRTFFHQRGANAHLAPEHFDFTRTRCRHFHVGYLLLLDKLDQLVDGEPRVTEVLRRASEAGLSTSVDCVSEAGERFRSVIQPALPWIDLFFANDYETERIVGFPLRRNGVIDAPAVGAAGRWIARHGVRQWVVIHFPEAVYACSPSGEGFWQGSLRVGAGEIAGTAGAGDALAAGILHGFHEGWTMSESLRLGVCTAASSLFHPTCSEGVRTKDECLALGERLGYRTLPA